MDAKKNPNSYIIVRNEAMNMSDMSVYVLSTLRLMTNRFARQMTSADPESMIAYSIGTTEHRLSNSMNTNIRNTLAHLNDIGYIKFMKSTKGSYLIDTSNLFKEYGTFEYSFDTFQNYSNIFESGFSFSQKIRLYAFWARLVSTFNVKDKCSWYSMSRLSEQDMLNTTTASIRKYLQILEALKVAYVYHQGSIDPDKSEYTLPANVIGRYDDKELVIKKGTELAHKVSNF